MTEFERAAEELWKRINGPETVLDDEEGTLAKSIIADLLTSHARPAEDEAKATALDALKSVADWIGEWGPELHPRAKQELAFVADEVVEAIAVLTPAAAQAERGEG